MPSSRVASADSAKKKAKKKPKVSDVELTTLTKPPMRVTVTGGAGQIAYSLVPTLLTGSVFGRDQPVFLQLLDIPPAMTAVEGVIMECEDLREPLYAGALGTSDPAVAFKDADVVIFLGAFPRKAGMERKDVMEKNVRA